MNRSNACDSFAPQSDSSTDRATDTSSGISQSVRWQGDGFKEALNSMKSADTGSAHLPVLSLGRDSEDALSSLEASLKKLEQDLHAFEQDLTKLQQGSASSDLPQNSSIRQTDNNTPSSSDAAIVDNAPSSSDAAFVNNAPSRSDTPSNPSDQPNDTPQSTEAPSTPNQLNEPSKSDTNTLSGSDENRPPTPTGDVGPGQWTQQTVNGMKYGVLLPADYDPSKSYPTVLYLHQLDMGTDEPDLLNEVNPWFNSTSYRTNNPSIVVMPLLDQTANPSGEQINFGGVSNDAQAGEDNAIAALKQVESQYSVDRSRVYVTGNSLGGIGTWDMLTKYNAVNGTNEKIFAAGMPLAGNDYAAGGSNPDPNVVNELKDVPIWAVHGADDQQVPNTWDRSLAQSLADDQNFHYTELPTGHDVWDTVYPDQTYWTWLFNQHA